MKCPYAKFHFSFQGTKQQYDINKRKKKTAQYLDWLGFPIFQKYGKYDISSSINLSFLKSDIFSVKISFLVVCYRRLKGNVKFQLYIYHDIQIFPGSQLMPAGNQVILPKVPPLLYTPHFTLFMTCRPANQADVACEPI